MSSHTKHRFSFDSFISTVHKYTVLYLYCIVFYADVGCRKPDVRCACIPSMKCCVHIHQPVRPRPRPRPRPLFGCIWYTSCIIHVPGTGTCICICTRCRSRTTICQSTFSFLNSMFIKTRIIHPSIPSMLNVVRCRQTWNYIRFFACTFYFSIMIHTLIIHSEVHITYYYYLTNSTVVLYS